MDNPLLFKICFAVVTGSLVFEIIALCATAKVEKRKNGNNANHNGNNANHNGDKQSQFLGGIPECSPFLVALAVWVIVVCVVIIGIVGG